VFIVDGEDGTLPGCWGCLEKEVENITYPS